MLKIGAAIVLLLMLAGCGPQSITEHFPHIERPYFLQKTSVVHEPLSHLLLNPRQLFPLAYEVTPVPGDAILLPRLDPRGAVLKVGRNSSIRERALVTYNIFLKSTAQSSSFTTVQIVLFSFSSLSKAVAWLRRMREGSPAYTFFKAVSSPGVSPHEFAREVRLIGYVGKLVYVQQRNIVIRITTIVPQEHPSFKVGDAVVTAESAAVSSAQ